VYVEFEVVVTKDGSTTSNKANELYEPFGSLLLIQGFRRLVCTFNISNHVLDGSVPPIAVRRVVDKKMYKGVSEMLIT